MPQKLHLYFTLAPYDAEYVPMVADRSVCGTAEAQPYPPEVEEQAAGHEAADSKASQGGITVGTGASQGQGAADVQQGR